MEMNGQEDKTSGFWAKGPGSALIRCVSSKSEDNAAHISGGVI